MSKQTIWFVFRCYIWVGCPWLEPCNKLNAPVPCSHECGFNTDIQYSWKAVVFWSVSRCTTKSSPPWKMSPQGGIFPRFPRKFSPPGEYFLGKFAPRGGIFPRKNTPPHQANLPPGGEVFLGICTPGGQFS